MNRREFSVSSIEAIALALLARVLTAGDLLHRGRPARTVREWVSEQDALARALSAGTISGSQWQSSVERLAREVDLDALLEAVDADRVERSVDASHPGGGKAFVHLDPSLTDGKRVTFGAAIFGLQKNHAITPHAHKNMVSAHMVIAGELHVRNFQRIAEEPGHLVIQPTVDRVIRRGDISTMSTERDNVHWFTAKTDKAFTLDVVVDGLVAGDAEYVIQLLDPRGAERVGGSQLRARIIDWDESVRLYGVES